ncbi:MAG: nucleotidyltransferase family protein [Rhodobacter sp.]|nr:nucleotidyltransferase family protein [Rhodobacter sp.]MCA3492669.1 nucleotidyltransferase family protein [Rhodobacter sp.]MCA3499806.1 nucleotidyltransferase family protein [Rhodobacter sp.]MCA3502158.1 nucleotidyltransferase family protein [Rhodobacter sp.]MCA3516768.1 nucleotidyltransferase family protein [Rhodobacter sp.]
MTPPAILLLAAGSSSRMRGADKLMEPVEGVPLLLRQARVALATGAPVIVTLPLDRPARNAALAGLDLMTVPVPDAAQGLSASIRAGVRAAGARPVLVLLADLPEITTDDLSRLLARHAAISDLILHGTAADGTPGHPVLFPVWALPGLAVLTGDSGARDLLRQHRDRTEFIALPARHAVTDLDTPEDWAAWRAARGCRQV